MDSTRFDTLARGLTGHRSRRTALRLLAGGLLGGLLGQRGVGSGRAAQGGIAEQSPGTDVLLSCTAVGLVDCAGICCAAGEICVDGSCLGEVAQAGDTSDIQFNECAAQGLSDCGGICVDRGSDNSHCGACFTSCPLGGFCRDGVCAGLVCFDGLIDCDVGYCVDTLTDAFNCGRCGAACPAERPYCNRGFCIGNDQVETAAGGGDDTTEGIDCGGGTEQTDAFGRKTGFCDPIMHEDERPEG
jgi:hypothetical protein